MHYKVNIRTKLTSYFLFIVVLSSILSVVFFVSHVLIVGKYRQVQDNIFLQYQLIETTSALVADYNVYRSTINTADLAAYETDKENIHNILERLEKSIVHKDSRSLLVGVNNTLESILTETDNGVLSIQAGDVVDTSTHYSEAYRKFSFAQENITNLILKEVGHGQALGIEIEKNNQNLLIFGGVLFITTLIFLIILSIFLPGSFVVPLTRLTLLAKSISEGNLEKNVDQDLTERKDEFGSLASSFSIMVENLRKNMTTLTNSNEIMTNKNQELEKLNAFMIDRELKMIELKKKIEELEKNSQKA